MEDYSLNASYTKQQTNGGPYVKTQYYPLVEQYYYPYYTYWTNEDKISKAFKLAEKLINKKLIKEPEKVKDFIELVNELVELV